MKDVAAGIIINDGRILIARRAKGQKSEDKWEFPGGKVEPGETPEEALKREIMEELSLEIEVGEFFMESNFKYDFGEIRLLVYKARCMDKNLNLSVHSEAKWVKPMDIRNYDYAPADIPVAERLFGTVI